MNPIKPLATAGTCIACTVSVDALLNMCKITFHSLADSQAALARINDSVAPSSPAVKCSGTIETGMKTLIGTPQSISLDAASLGRGSFSF